MKYPTYISLGGDGECCIRLMEARKNKSAIYYRHGGAWEARVRWKDGKLQYKVLGSWNPQHYYEDGAVECTEEEWEKSNKGYLPT